jgi:hypothetical protein
MSSHGSVKSQARLQSVLDIYGNRHLVSNFGSLTGSHPRPSQHVPKQVHGGL